MAGAREAREQRAEARARPRVRLTDPEATGPAERAARIVAELARTVARLRSPDGGCPWDREQTHASVRAELLEEANEVAEAIDHGDPAALREELGDLLFHVVFHAQLAAEAGDFDLADVADGIVAKLVRRHPHVFAGAPVPDDLLAQWERIKREEKAGGLHAPKERRE